MKILAEMGHGDVIAFGDANFPAKSSKAACGAGGCILIPALLDAVLELFPIDTFVPQPVKLMQVVPGDDYVPEVVEDYKRSWPNTASARIKSNTWSVSDFYDHTDTAYCVVATGETARYANITLKKGRYRLKRKSCGRTSSRSFSFCVLTLSENRIKPSLTFSSKSIRDRACYSWKTAACY